MEVVLHVGPGLVDIQCLTFLALNVSFAAAAALALDFDMKNLDLDLFYILHIKIVLGPTYFFRHFNLQFPIVVF